VVSGVSAIAELVQDQVLLLEARLDTMREMLRLAESLEGDSAPDSEEEIEESEPGPRFDEPDEPEDEEPRNDEREARVLRALAAGHEPMRRGEIVQYTGLNENTVHDVLARLVAGGQVVRNGERAGTRYELNVEAGNGDGRRRCAEDGCDTILSAYNEDQYCAVHDRAAASA